MCEVASCYLSTLIHRIYNPFNSPLPISFGRIFARIRKHILVAAMALQLSLELPEPTRRRFDLHPEHQYLRLMRRIWETGDERVDRTGVGTRSVFGAVLRYELSDSEMPLITTKRVYWKTATREFLWFLTGDTNIRALCGQGVQIWTDWPLDRYRKASGEAISREDFSARVVADAEFAAKWGDLGPVYGKQWVDWPTFEPAGEGLFRKGKGINQVAQVVHSLRNNPGSRRHIVEGWNVAELDQMALPPCHKTYQFHVVGNRLNCLLHRLNGSPSATSQLRW